jgi:hypothetical protein
MEKKKAYEARPKGRETQIKSLRAIKRPTRPGLRAEKYK